MKTLSSVLIVIGFLSIMVGFVISVAIFYPVITVELNYQLDNLQGRLAVKREIQPLDSQFGIVIPKIGANAKIIPNVDPYDENQYQEALTQGVAHARFTVFPGEGGNMFLFAHSSVNFLEAQKYNSIFYLLYKLEKGDEIDLYYNGEKFKYLVTEKKTVGADEVKYLSGDGSKKTVTLMTCWPPGTTYKRLLVIGEAAKD